MIEMEGNFANCLKITLHEEGGFSDNPHDPGGATMCGVTQRVYDAWRSRAGEGLQGVRRIAPEEISAIYRELYWDNVRGSALPVGVDLMVFDEGVNSGPHRSILDLQRCVGVNPDGLLGPMTLQAIDRANPADLITSLADWRLSWLGRLAGWRYFSRGWAARVESVKSASLAMVGK
jgi:lysozyme family protein